MSRTCIRFSSDILRRLGEELNPSPDRGILELVKNAYDADARACIVELDHTDSPGGTVRVIDDGDGMRRKEIRNGWLVLGRSYGNPGHDWLDLNLRRTRSPEERPGTNTAIGRVRVHDDTGLLAQKTDRSGMIEGEAFGAMRAFAQDAMEWMAKRRLEAAERRRAKERAAAPERTSRSKKALDDAIADPGVPETAQTAIRKAMKTYDQSREREVTRLHKEVQLYRTLSTAGITAATFAHESSGNPIKIITVNAKTVRRRAKKELGDDYGPLLQKPVDGILQATQSLAVLGDATLKLVAHDKRRLSRVEIHDVIGRVLATFEPFLAGRDVKPQQCLCGGNPYLRASEAAVESIITNLLNNSVTAFEQSSVSQREIRIVTEIEEDTLVLRVLDNGPGIESINVRDIWLPGQTTRANGTGLGLTIVRDTVSDLGGEVDAIEHGELGGAEMIVHLPILGE